ncbi:hypothetical protein B0H19DRAFT_1081561 [Mycena capillaripes]|nr:hypothetical protein B0H19DRAFT_1081561 [Mycena capillaripes]
MKDEAGARPIVQEPVIGKRRGRGREQLGRGEERVADSKAVEKRRPELLAWSCLSVRWTRIKRKEFRQRRVKAVMVTSVPVGQPTRETLNLRASPYIMMMHPQRLSLWAVAAGLNVSSTLICANFATSAFDNDDALPARHSIFDSVEAVVALMLRKFQPPVTRACKNCAMAKSDSGVPLDTSAQTSKSLTPSFALYAADRAAHHSERALGRLGGSLAPTLDPPSFRSSTCAPSIFVYVTLLFLVSDFLGFLLFKQMNRSIGRRFPVPPAILARISEYLAGGYLLLNSPVLYKRLSKPL